MATDSQHEFILKVLDIVDKHDYHRSLHWQVTDGHVDFFILCSDLFFWGCADDEEITEENLPILEQSFKDHNILGDLLFCCRVRKMRPQGAYYKQFDPQAGLLFDECGPERVIDMGNPRKPETKK